MTEILAKTQVAIASALQSNISTPSPTFTEEPQGFAPFPYDRSLTPETITELEERATELRANYRIVSEALFEFGDQLIQLKQKIKKAGLKWSEWSNFHFPDLDKQLKDAMAISHIWRQLWEDDYHLIEKMKGWGTPVISQICRGGLEFVKKFLAENDNPLAWTVKAAKALVREWKNPQPKDPDKQPPQKARPVASTARLAAIDKAISQLGHLQSMKATLTEELETAVTSEVRDNLRQKLHHTELKIEAAIATLIDSESTDYQNTENLTDTLQSENQLLKEQLDRLQAQQVVVVTEQPEPQHYQSQIEALQTQLEQQYQENARLSQQLREQDAENQQSSSENWQREKQVLEQRIAELEKTLSQKSATTSTQASKPNFSPNCIVRIVNSGNGSIVGHLGRYLGEGTAINKLGDPYPVAEVLLEEGSKYEKTVNVPNWTENLELVNLTLEEHQRVVAARYAVLEKKYLQEEVQQLNERIDELKSIYSTEAIATDLGRMLAPAIGADKVQELLATSKNGLKAIGRYLMELLMEPAF